MRTRLFASCLVFSCVGLPARSVPTRDSLTGDHVGERLFPRAIEDVGSEKLNPRGLQPPDSNSEVTVNIIVMGPSEQGVQPSNQGMGNTPPTDPNQCPCACVCPYDQFEVPRPGSGENSSPGVAAPTTVIDSQSPPPPVGPMSTSQIAIVPLSELTSQLPLSTPQAGPSGVPRPSNNVEESPATSAITVSSKTSRTTSFATSIPSIESEATTTSSTPSAAAVLSPPSPSSTSSTTSTASTDTSTTSTTTSTTQQASSSSSTEEAGLDPSTLQLHSVLTLNLGG